MDLRRERVEDWGQRLEKRSLWGLKRRPGVAQQPRAAQLSALKETLPVVYIPEEATTPTPTSP